MRGLQAAGGTAITEHTDAVRGLRWLIVAIGVGGFLLDQAIKTLALARLDPQQPVELLGGLVTLRLIRNPGAAFSMGENLTVLLTIVAIGALAGVAGWLAPRVRHRGWAVAVGCLLAGISGNLFDRLFREPGPFRGHVVDFIQLPYFAIFNVADMFITAAAVLVIWLSLVRQVNLAGVRVSDADQAPETND